MPDKAHPAKNLVLVNFGGGKDSAWVTAYTRLVQLIMREKHGESFRLRVATGLHPGMQQPVMDNIDATYKALGMVDDPQVERIMVANNRVMPFEHTLAMPEDVTRQNRMDVLMAAHRFAADPRASFCTACNGNLSNWIGTAAAYKGTPDHPDKPADFVITGDSIREMAAYDHWIDIAVNTLGVPAAEDARVSRIAQRLQELDRVRQGYTAELFGKDSPEMAERHVESHLPDHCKAFSIFKEAHYAAGDHLLFLRQFLHLSFDSIMASFTETDCGNPALMAHLNGLAAEHIHRQSYDDGMREYAKFAIGMMHKKKFPAELIDEMERRYAPHMIVTRRREAERYAKEAYGFTSEQLVCMVYAPFTAHGKNLQVFLEREHPELLGQKAAICELLSHTMSLAKDEIPLADQLESISGMSIGMLRHCYASSLLHDPFDTDQMRLSEEPLARLQRPDPHQEIIQSRINQSGKTQPKHMSGR